MDDLTGFTKSRKNRCIRPEIGRISKKRVEVYGGNTGSEEVIVVGDVLVERKIVRKVEISL